MTDLIRCIVVDDYEPLNNVFTNILDYEADISVVGRAYESNGLFDILETTEVDVILLDIEMTTREEGIVACKKISREYPDIKVIILTCHEEEDMILLAFEAGAVDYVLKTSSSSQIHDAVRSAYNNESSFNSKVSQVIRSHLKEYGSMKQSLLYMTNIIASLTASELHVLHLLMNGKKNKEIAAIRNVEVVTVKAHISSILRKFDENRMAKVIVLLKKLGLESFLTPGKAELNLNCEGSRN